jgi:hypothetical protein
MLAVYQQLSQVVSCLRVNVTGVKCGVKLEPHGRCQARRCPRNSGRRRHDAPARACASFQQHHHEPLSRRQDLTHDWVT